MEEEMEVELPVFEAREIDLEYEFDAARFFDFTREESFAEAREAELWFESAPNYPPSRESLLSFETLTFPQSDKSFTFSPSFFDSVSHLHVPYEICTFFFLNLSLIIAV